MILFPSDVNQIWRAELSDSACRNGRGLIWRDGYHYKKAGVMLLDLTRADRVQGALFDRPDGPRSKTRILAVDSLNRRFDRNTVTYAAAGTGRAWSMQRGSLSPRYTTDWSELLLVRDALPPEQALREWKVAARLNRTGVSDDNPTVIEPISP